MNKIEHLIKALEIDEQLILFGFEDLKEEFVGLYKEIVKGAIKNRGGKTISEIGFFAGLPITLAYPEGEIFAVTPEIEGWIELRAYDFWNQISQTTKGELKAEIKIALEQGETVDELKVRIQNVFEGTEREDAYRARLIARTETTSALNYATQKSYEQSGVVIKKQWLTAGDEKVRPDHRMMDGVIADLNKPFYVGVNQFPMMYPGDPSASANLVVNCRCGILSVIEENLEEARILEIRLQKERISME